MKQLIDKDSLVAEIEKIIEEPAPSHDQQCPWEDGYYCGLYKAESIIDTFETKEVDLEKELERLDSLLYDLDGIAIAGTTSYLTVEDVKTIAKNFFEMGLKTQIGSIKEPEVDLEEEVEDWVKTGPHTSYPWCTIPDAIRITAEHFYELGLKKGYAN